MENTFNPELNNIIEENSDVNISDEVVSIIASIAASEVKGIAGMGGSTISGGFAELLGKKNPSKGVKVTVEENKISLDLSVVVEYGVKILDVAWELQEKVKNEVETMTGLEIEAVNISVDGINVPKQENKDNDELQEDVEVELGTEEE